MKVEDHSTRVELSADDIIRIANGGKVVHDGMVVEGESKCMDRLIVEIARRVK